ncbi:MAG TPA: ParB/RepB/Spo0J family partition protein [Candidatus Cloacimonadota bacterium]|nr:ParB/RepB/Spo0J family partition protein [Candidatus Cloacimonadota bacterium]
MADLSLENMKERYQVHQIPVKEIFADPDFNCRGSFSALSVVDIADDIKKNGLHAPIIVRTLKEPKDGKKYIIVAGHRRFKAHQVNEAETIPCFIRDDLSDVEARFINLAENIKRADLNIMDETNALGKFIDLGMTQQEIADKLSSTRGWVQVRCMLLQLPKEFQEEARLGNINQTMIRDLYTIRKNGGSIDDMVQLVHKYKGTKGTANGKKMTIRVAKKDAKRQRHVSEVLELQTLIRETFGNGLATRALAWTIGEISDYDMLLTVEHVAKENNIKFVMPESQCISTTSQLVGDNSDSEQ